MVSGTGNLPGMDDAEVLIPAGAELLDAAAWVGRSCWIELTVHQRLTDWLADESDPQLAAALWTVRSRRAELAERWHRRLPELRELARAGFVEPDAEAETLLAPLAGEVSGDARRKRLAEVLDALLERYRSQVHVVVGPADAPTARTLAEAIEATGADRAELVQVPLSLT